MSDCVHVSMFGSFSLSVGNCLMDDGSNRMRKVWLLLAYILYNRNARPTQEQLLSLLDTAGSDSEDPSGKLKALFYRARMMLAPLSEAVGQPLIVHQNGSYRWNPDVPVSLDIEEFDRLRKELATLPKEQQAEKAREALALYRGDFLAKLSMDSWVMPVNAYYHQRYLELVLDTLSLLQEQKRFAEAVILCRQALTIEPYSEELYQHLMESLIATDKRNMAVAAYETMSEVLFANFGVMPSEESRSLYREATKEKRDSSVSGDLIREHLKEPSGATGAMFCEYDFFKLLYQVQSRSIVRSGDTVHIALFSLHGEDRRELPRRSLDCAMDNLKELMINSLRQGDVITRYSASQFIVMLPQANYENSCSVCKRIVKSFYRQYPHSPAQIGYSVHPLEPLPAAR